MLVLDPFGTVVADGAAAAGTGTGETGREEPVGAGLAAASGVGGMFWELGDKGDFDG